MQIQETRVYKEIKEEGQELVKIQVAKKTLARDMSLETISEVTELSLSQILKIQQEGNNDCLTATDTALELERDRTTQ